MSEDIRLGIGVITFNRGPQVLRTLEKVCLHTGRSHQLVVADDGSTDGTADALIRDGYSVVTGPNRGVCWNKNRALFYLSEIRQCNVVLLLEDDTFPTKDGWETVWVEAVRRFGHIGLAGSWFRASFTAGDGTVESPYRSPVVSGQCAGFSAACMAAVGYFDTRFKGYGVGHAEHSMRCIRAGYGGEVRIEDKVDKYTFYLVNSDLTVTDPGGNRNQDQIARNHALLQSIKGEPAYRPSWRDDQEREQLQKEMREILTPDNGDRRTRPSVEIAGGPVFDEDFYLRRYQDVAAAVRRGAFRSGLHHYKLFGIREGRQISEKSLRAGAGYSKAHKGHS